MKSLFKRMLNKTRAARSKMDEYQESLTFAEAGETLQSAAMPEEQQAELPGFLLVIGNGSSFSRRIIDYALEMAQRMSYEILALNVAPLPRETIKLFAPAQNKIQEFEASASENARQFQEAAHQMGISFTHAVKFGDTDSAIQEASKEYGTIEFVVSEPAEEQAAERPENENRPDKQLYVYSMV